MRERGGRERERERKREQEEEERKRTHREKTEGARENGTPSSISMRDAHVRMNMRILKSSPRLFHSDRSLLGLAGAKRLQTRREK